MSDHWCLKCPSFWTEVFQLNNQRKYRSQEIGLIIMPMIVLITGHFSNSAELLKFRSKGEIPWLCSKFRGTRKPVGRRNCMLDMCATSDNLLIAKTFNNQYHALQTLTSPTFTSPCSSELCWTEYSIDSFRATCPVLPVAILSHTVQSIPAVAKDIFVWIVGPRRSANYFNCAA